MNVVAKEIKDVVAKQGLKGLSAAFNKFFPVYKKIVIPLNVILMVIYFAILATSIIIFILSGQQLLDHALKNGISLKDILVDKKHILSIQNWTDRNFVSVILADISAGFGILTALSLSTEFILNFLVKQKFNMRKSIFYGTVIFIMLIISALTLYLFNTSSIPIKYTETNGFELLGQSEENSLNILDIDKNKTSVSWVDLFPATPIGSNNNSDVVLKATDIKEGTFKIVLITIISVLFVTCLAYVISSIVVESKNKSNKNKISSTLILNNAIETKPKNEMIKDEQESTTVKVDEKVKN